MDFLGPFVKGVFLEDSGFLEETGTRALSPLSGPTANNTPSELLIIVEAALTRGKSPFLLLRVLGPDFLK